MSYEHSYAHNTLKAWGRLVSLMILVPYYFSLQGNSNITQKYYISHHASLSIEYRKGVLTKTIIRNGNSTYKMFNCMDPAHVGVFRFMRLISHG